MSNLPLSTTRLTHLIGVPGHAVYAGQTREHVYLGERWIRGHALYRYDDEVPLYVEHIRAAIVLANDDPHAMVVFTGGLTGEPAAFVHVEPLSEAQGYWNVAAQCGWFNCPSVRERAAREEYARDSYENLDFSRRLFQDVTGTPPSKVTFVGLQFKKERYEFHADTLRRRNNVAPFRFEYVGINNPPHYVLDGGSRFGELATLAAFKRDPYGNDPAGELHAKRRRRDPLNRGEYPERAAQ